jgi:hypothetical protein
VSAFCRRGRVEPTRHHGGTRHSAPLAHGGPSFGSAGDGGRMQARPGQSGRTHHSSAARPSWLILLKAKSDEIEAILELAPASCGAAKGVRVSSGRGAGPMPFTHTIRPGVWRGTDAPVDTNAGMRSAVKAGPEEQIGQKGRN